jgi:hypothetical protein
VVEKLKEALQLLEDQLIKGKYDDLPSKLSGLQSKHDEFGQPLYEEGLCSLVDEYWNENEEEDF